ncbi:MAG: PTS sugar transporter subunit IIA [Phycisphaerales bacterium]|nr:PTS sugar transporter subunit IIA [Phycisphaerales bacterium]
MNLLDIVIKDAINTDLQSTDREGTLLEMLTLLVSSGTVSEDLKGEFHKAIIKREKRGSTGFGHGVAVPHIKHEAIKTMAVAIGVSKSGIDFNALDGNPVHSIFLLLSPENQPNEHLEAMEAIFGNLSQETFRRFLLQANSPEEVLVLLGEADTSQIDS